MCVRLLHAPTGRAATLFTTEDEDQRGVTTGGDTYWPWAFESLIGPAQLPSASPFSRVWCSLYVGYRAVGEAASAPAPAFHTGAEPPAWMRESRFGFLSGWAIEFGFGDDGLHHVPQRLREMEGSRLVHRALQALPWTA